MADSIPSEALELREAVSTPGALRPDGSVALHILRPCVGRGKGRHLYEADMLERNARVFEGWKMYLNHQSPEAKRRQGGLPRDIQEVGGIIRESYWDPNVPADPSRGYERGAIVGIAKPVPLVRELIETDPSLVETSINGNATNVRKVQRGSESVWLVEGIRPKGSVDWVTEAGAGGRVVELMEATIEETLRETNTDLLSMSSEDMAAWLREEHPEVVEALRSDEGGEVADVTPEALQEALSSDAAKATIAEAVGEALTAALGNPDFVRPLVEAAATEIEEEARDNAEALARRGHWLRDARDIAHQRIEEARLPGMLPSRLKSEFDLTEAGEPTPGLDVIEDVDGEGVVTKSATDKLKEKVDAAIAEARELAGSINPTRVRGQGSSGAVRDGDGDKPPTDESKKTTGSEEADELLKEAGFTDDDLGSMFSLSEAPVG